MVANLAEQAAENIKANSNLVRVGAFYHDIGKQSGTLFRKRMGGSRGAICGCGSNSRARQGSVRCPWIVTPR
jgi:hypothetical protein